MTSSPTIAVIGTGYVGLTTAAILANAGYRVRALDVDEHKIATIREGKSHFYEHGLTPLIGAAIASGALTATTDYAEAIPGADIAISCVGTPDNPDGSPNLEHVYQSARDIVAHADRPLIYVQKSTVPVGTGADLSDLFGREFPDASVSYISNPEFLRESSAISDTLGADRVIVGGEDVETVERVAALYRSVDEQRAALAATAQITPPPDDYELQLVKTTVKSAELVKVSANAFLALKISFANSIAKLADAAEADVVEVMDGIGLDRRIGRAFLNAGRGYGGGCFPKDVSGLISTAHHHGIDLHIMQAATEVNDSMPGYVVHRAKRAFGSLEGVEVGVLGLAFKSGTSDARKSPAVAIANSLAHENAHVRAYDPYANDEAAPDVNREVAIMESQEAALSGAQIAFIATDWPQFKELDYTHLASQGVELVVDCMNALDETVVTEAGLRYVGVGRR